MDGTGSTTEPGDIQHLHAGIGVVHGELHASRIEPVRLLQTWRVPTRRGIAPGCERGPGARSRDTGLSRC